MKKIIKLLLRNFVNAKIGDLATNLTYVSFISIFPLVAVVMGLSKGFGLDRLLVNRLKEYVPSSETQLNYILEVAEKLINSLNSSVLSGVGLVIILWSVINLLMILEKSINIVWQVRENRNLSRRIINYIAIIFIIPIVLLLLIGTNDKILQILSSFSEIGVFTIVIMNILKLLIMISIVTFMYYAVPNTYVSLKSSVISATTVILTLLILSNFYGFVQNSISKYNAIYGSLAFVPLFLVWVRYLWIIVLTGVQLTYILDSKDFSFENKINILSKKSLCIQVYALIVSRFFENKNPYSVKQISDKLGINIQLILHTLRCLENMGYVVKLERRTLFYQVNINPENITIKD
ncbi:YihY family inner membrane protein, partial [Sneathia sp. DSM 16630]|nr:YihY family inner membrane protein [Sneathia sp. DSM 16630]